MVLIIMVRQKGEGDGESCGDDGDDEIQSEGKRISINSFSGLNSGH